MSKHPSVKTPPYIPHRRKAMNGLVLDVSSASALYGPSERAIWGMIANGTLPARKLSGRVCFLRSELDQFFTNLPGITLAEARKNAVIRRKGGG